jgi:hypothetical protein
MKNSASQTTELVGGLPRDPLGQSLFFAEASEKSFFGTTSDVGISADFLQFWRDWRCEKL